MQHPIEHDITALAYGLIEGPERETLLTHLSECDACRATYDAYREEQAIVRDSVVRDARSGAAEAKALENTLRILGALDTEEETSAKRGRLLSLPTWLIVGEIAAMLIVAFGLFVLLKPTEETAIPADNTVGENPTAPAEVNQGVVYVRDTAGDWKPTEKMPMDAWMMAGPAQALSFTMADGSKAQLDEGAVFRISREGGQPIVYMLHGSGEIDASDSPREFFVRAGETGFSAAPGARISLRCAVGESFTPGDAQVWSRPERVSAKILEGNVVLKSEQRGYYFMPLRNGERVERTPADLRVIEADGNELGFAPAQYMVWTRELDGNLNETELAQIHLLLRNEINTLKPRFRLLQQRLEEARPTDPRYKADFERQLKELDRVKGMFEIVIDTDDMTVIQIDDERMTVSTDGETITVVTSDKSGSITYTAKTPEAIRAKLPEHLRERFDGITFEHDYDDRLRIKNAHAESNDGKTIKVTAMSGSSSGK